MEERVCVCGRDREGDRDSKEIENERKKKKRGGGGGGSKKMPDAMKDECEKKGHETKPTVEVDMFISFLWIE